MSTETGTSQNTACGVTATRFQGNPLITFKSHRCLRRNISGPSVIRVPAWIDQPLGKYYMYFGHHSGDRIRLAYADHLHGSWKIHKPGSLRLEDAPAFEGHIASPDVHIDDVNREIRMYFHGPARERDRQWTGIAFSRNGLDFHASREILGKPYFRVFRFGEYHYAIAKDWNSGWGELYRSKDGRSEFESLKQIIRNVRHTALKTSGRQLMVFYSRKGDAPERILLSTIELKDDWREWSASEPVEVIRPEHKYEGTRYKNRPSKYGAAIRVQQLRDPCIFEEEGRTYLFYCVAGEMAIAMAELFFEFPETAAG